MANEVWYGADCEARIGVMADASTDPTSWNYLEFKTFTATPTRERSDRPLMGRTRNNALDPMKPVAGLFKLAAELVIDADSLTLPRVLRNVLGAPTTTGPASSIYTHVWTSGDKSQNYCAIQVRTGSGEVRIYRGITLSAITLDGKGDQANNYDISISLRGLSRDRQSDFIGSAPASALPAASSAARMLFKIDSGSGLVAASNVLSAQWSWDRQIAEDAFLSSAVALTGLRPAGGKLSGQCQLRSNGSAFDDLEEGDTDLDVIVQFTGLTAGHDITFEHPKAELLAAPFPVNGPGLIERTFGWDAHQDASSAAAKITVKNGVSSYP